MSDLQIDEMRKDGVSCLTYGMHVLGQPSIISPRERYESISIPGRTGSLTQLEGKNVHDNISLSVTCLIDGVTYTKNNEIYNRVAEIMQWISGDGKYEFYGHDGGYYKGRLANQVSFDRVVQGNPHKAFTFQFDCQPYFYLHAGDETETVQETTHWVTNVANMPAKPLIKIYGSGNGTIMTQGGNTMLFTIPEIGHIVIDCEAEVVYTEDPTTGAKALAGTSVQGDFFTIPEARTSSIVVTGNVSRYELTPRWRQM